MNRLATWSVASALALAAGSANAQERVQPDSTAQSAAVRTVIVDAIRLGVPLYNEGQTEACAAIYRIALRSLHLLAPSTVDTSAVEEALGTAARQDPQQGAWTLRRALDSIYQTTESSAMVDEDSFQIDFANDASSWYVVNDNVMGGVSRGGFARTSDGTGQFAGQLSMRNNGGFSSVRTKIPRGALTGFDGIEMRVRGDDRTYTLLAAPERSRGSWQHDFVAGDQWQTVRLPFGEMKLSIRGWQPPSAAPIRGQDVGMLGLLVADKNTSPFQLEVDWIRGYADEVAAATSPSDRGSQR